MKKIILGLTLLVAAVVTFAFTRPTQSAQDSKAVYNVIYRFDGAQTQLDFEDETKWVQVSTAESIGCSGDGAVCWISYTDQVGSSNPPTLPSGFNPLLIEHGEKDE